MSSPSWQMTQKVGSPNGFKTNAEYDAAWNGLYQLNEKLYGEKNVYGGRGPNANRLPETTQQSSPKAPDMSMYRQGQAQPKQQSFGAPYNPQSSGSVNMSAWGRPQAPSQNFGAPQQPTFNVTNQQSAMGNWGNNPTGRPQGFQANYYDLQGNPTSFEQQQAQRAAMVEQMRQAELPYVLANSFNQNLGPQQYDFNSMLQGANKAVENGYYNPFQRYFQEQDMMQRLAQQGPPQMYQTGGQGMPAPRYVDPGQGWKKEIGGPGWMSDDGEYWDGSGQPPRSPASGPPVDRNGRVIGESGLSNGWGNSPTYKYNTDPTIGNREFRNWLDQTSPVMDLSYNRARNEWLYDKYLSETRGAPQPPAGGDPTAQQQTGWRGNYFNGYLAGQLEPQVLANNPGLSRPVGQRFMFIGDAGISEQIMGTEAFERAMREEMARPTPPFMPRPPSGVQGGSQGANGFAPGYGARIANPGVLMTTQLIDSDRDGVDDRSQRGPGMPRERIASNPSTAAPYGGGWPDRRREVYTPEKAAAIQEDARWQQASALSEAKARQAAIASPARSIPPQDTGTPYGSAGSGLPPVPAMSEADARRAFLQNQKDNDTSRVRDDWQQRRQQQAAEASKRKPGGKAPPGSDYGYAISHPSVNIVDFKDRDKDGVDDRYQDYPGGPSLVSPHQKRPPTTAEPLPDVGDPRRNFASDYWYNVSAEELKDRTGSSRPGLLRGNEREKALTRVGPDHLKWRSPPPEGSGMTFDNAIWNPAEQKWQLASEAPRTMVLHSQIVYKAKYPGGWFWSIIPGEAVESAWASRAAMQSGKISEQDWVAQQANDAAASGRSVTGAFNGYQINPPTTPGGKYTATPIARSPSWGSSDNREFARRMAAPVGTRR